VLSGALLAVVCEIWNHRNKVVFKNGRVDDVEIFYLAQMKGWLWVKNRTNRITLSIWDWLLCPIHCL